MDTPSAFVQDVGDKIRKLPRKLGDDVQYEFQEMLRKVAERLDDEVGHIARASQIASKAQQWVGSGDEGDAAQGQSKEGTCTRCVDINSDSYLTRTP